MDTYLIEDARSEDMRENLLDALLMRLRLTTDCKPFGVLAIDLDYLDDPDSLSVALNLQCGQSSN